MTVVAGPDAGTTVEGEQDGPLAIGIAPGNGLTLSDRTVSRFHAEVSVAAGGFLVRDLRSTNGTWVGNTRVHEAVVVPGTTLHLGATELVVADASQEAKASEDDVPHPRLLGVSPAIRRVRELVRKLGPSQVSVLIEGETGTGKEVVARALHDASPRAEGPFVVVDCGSIPPNLVSSELFGHEKGAFTGATTRVVGAFERAHGGTLFLDEVGELPLEMQPVLLGVLERRQFRRVGGTSDVQVDIRVVSATNRDLRSDANAERFRLDLLFRLAVARIELPPLRARVEDVEVLARHFRALLTGDGTLDEASVAALRARRWTGNVRELRNVVENWVVFGQLPIEERTDPEVALPLGTYRDARAAALAAFEREFLGRLIQESGGNASEAARRASMDRRYLLDLLRRHGLR
ncbi:MAG: sigma 54-dependent Fis family transcriptional regulator [Sandaracinus sp.]|nr:sigma 54-dependent Fis family transcriptional regulator [Sandaracinus sp.]